MPPSDRVLFGFRNPFSCASEYVHPVTTTEVVADHVCIRRSAQSICQSPALPSSLAPAARYLALAERHMVCCVQLHLMKSSFDAGTTPGDGSQGLEGTLVRAIILCVCTVSASFEVRAPHTFQLHRECRVRWGKAGGRRLHRHWWSGQSTIFGGPRETTA